MIMGMRMKFDIVKKGNIVSIKNVFGRKLNYLITNVSRKEKFLDAMPIIYDDDNYEIPMKLSIPFQMIEEVKNPDKIDLLYMLGKNNPMINKALEKILN